MFFSVQIHKLENCMQNYASDKGILWLKNTFEYYQNLRFVFGQYRLYILFISFSFFPFCPSLNRYCHHHQQQPQVTKIVEACEYHPMTQMIQALKPAALSMDRQAIPVVAVDMLHQKLWATKGNSYKATKVAAVYQLLAKITTKRQCYWVVMMNTNKFNT